MRVAAKGTLTRRFPPGKRRSGPWWTRTSQPDRNARTTRRARPPASPPRAVTQNAEPVLAAKSPPALIPNSGRNSALAPPVASCVALSGIALDTPPEFSRAGLRSGSRRLRRLLAAAGARPRRCAQVASADPGHAARARLRRRRPGPSSPQAGQSLEAVIPQLVHVLDGMLISGHPRSQVNVVAHPSIASIIGVVLPSMYNPNLCSDESGRGFSEAEVRVASMVARTRRLRPAASRRPVHVRRHRHAAVRPEDRPGKSAAGTFEHGLDGQAVILCSQQSHYACATVGRLAGHRAGERASRARRTPTTRSTCASLETAAREQHRGGQARSPPSSPRWARPTPSASTTWPPSTRSASGSSPSSSSTIARTCTPTP